ncbi:MAG: YchJ family metal-binding protein [Pseudomonadota bacterium]
MFETCPCGSGKGYLACCGRLHSGAPADSAEALMRARYTAYARGDAAYLTRSWAPETRPARIGIDPAQVWTGLEIASHEVTGPDTATVRFTARWKQNGRKGRLTETSRFRRDGAGWLYVDGDTG